MNLNRLNPLIVAAVGIGLSLLALVLIGFLLIKPALDARAAPQAQFDQSYPDSTPAAQRLALNQLNAAKVKVQQIKFQWKVKESEKMPRYDVSNRFTALSELTYELTHSLGPDLEHQLQTTGVSSTTKIALPAPPVNPNDITSAPVVIPLGTITVNGDFRHILTHFYKWRSFNRLVLANGLSFTGSSPYMQGSYNATLYIFPQNDDKLPPPIPEAGGAAAGAATAPGGYPGGSPGAPPGRG